MDTGSTNITKEPLRTPGGAVGERHADAAAVENPSKSGGESQSPVSAEKVRRMSIPAYTLSSIHNTANIPARTRRLSGNYNAEVWKRIFGDVDPSSVLQFDNEDTDDVGVYHQQTSDATSSTFGFSADFIPSLTSQVSGEIPITHSITAMAVTLSTPDFKTLDTEPAQKEVLPEQLTVVQRILAWFSCREPSAPGARRYWNLRSEFSTACTAILRFYSALEADFQDLESELDFDVPIPPPLPKQLNVMAAQVWFSSFVLSKQLSKLVKFDPETQKKLMSSFQSIVNDTICVGGCMSRLEQLISQIELEGLIDGVGHLKKSLTGRSDTDLTKEKIGDEIFAPSVPVPKPNRASRASAPPKIWNNKVEQHRPRRSSIAEQLGIYGPLHEHEDGDHEFSGRAPVSLLFSQQDTLKDRKNLEIYVRNITKVGWISFDHKFPVEQKFVVEDEFLSQAKNSMKVIAKRISRLLRKLEYGRGGGRASQFRELARTFRRKLVPCIFPETCLPWIKKMKTCIDEIVKNEYFSPADYEFLRVEILKTEMQMEKVVSHGAAVIQKGFNLISVVLLCSDFLSHVHQFQVPEYDKLRPKLILEPRAAVASKPLMAPTPRESAFRTATSRKSVRRHSRRATATAAEEKLDDADFFLDEYADLLKVVPLSFGLLEYILVNGIEPSERHSGVNFDGPRFLDVYR